jgi:oxygen-independent coproporphyrinogen-3 oxidase
MPVFLHSLGLEAGRESPEWPDEFDSVFLGGGSPSLLSPEEIPRLFAALAPLKASKSAEVTIECNPEDVSDAKVSAWRSLGVNRASLGAQSFSGQGLAALGRRHSAADTERAAASLRGAGLRLSLDLIYGWRGETLGLLEADLEKALSLGPEHLSLYSLTAEPGTPLYGELARGKSPPLPGEAEVAGMFLLAGEYLKGRGFRRYEVSNFAAPGKECRHNLKYWHRLPYLGLGPSAHSFNGRSRRASRGSLVRWADALRRGESPASFSEDLSAESERLERLFLGLRLSSGIPEGLATDPAAEERLVREGLLERVGGRLRPTEKGFLSADYAARVLA